MLLREQNHRSGEACLATFYLWFCPLDCLLGSCGSEGWLARKEGPLAVLIPLLTHHCLGGKEAAHLCMAGTMGTEQSSCDRLARMYLSSVVASQ